MTNSIKFTLENGILTRNIRCSFSPQVQCYFWFQYGASTSSVLNSGRARTRRTYYSEPLYNSNAYRQDRASRYTSEPVNISHIDEGDEPDQARYLGRPNYRPPQHRRVDKAKTITFFRNGDAQFPGYTTSVSTREFRSWETLLVFLSDKISLPYGVRLVRNLSHGQLNFYPVRSAMMLTKNLFSKMW